MTQMQLFNQSPKPWQPHNYQKKAVKFLLEHAAGALFLDPGLGKTSITLAAIKMLKKKKLLSKVLLIAPLRVCHNVWPNEVIKWKDFNELKIVVLHGKDKEKLLKEEADIFVINPEGLDWLLDVQKTKGISGKTSVSINKKRWKALEFDTLIIDELSKFKHSSTNRFKSLKLVLDTFSRRWGLTGSPASNGLLDLFGQCYIIDQGNALGKYITHYRSQYFLPSYDGFGWTPQEGAEERIYEKLAPLALRMSADDYLDMPELIENNIYIELPEDARSIYDELEDDLITKVNSDVIVASTAAVASMKCRQVANGGIYYEPELKALFPKASSKEWHNIHTAKVDALIDLIEELQGSPLLVAYDFEHDLDRIRKKLGKDIPYIGGGVTSKRSIEIVNDWNAGKIPVLLGHPQAMAHGLNLQEMGNHVCWHSLTWNFELYDQFIRRVYRQGNKSQSVFIHHIMAKNTIDHAMLSALKSKNKGQKALFDALKNYAKNL